MGEAKSHHRLLAFARKADEEGYSQVAKLFRAVAAAEGVQSTEENLRSSFERAAVLTFSQARDVEEGHAALYKHALGAMLHDETHDYYVCQVCGYVAERDLPRPVPHLRRKAGEVSHLLTPARSGDLQTIVTIVATLGAEPPVDETRRTEEVEGLFTLPV